jgi:hypothetical protein
MLVASSSLFFTYQHHLLPVSSVGTSGSEYGLIFVSKKIAWSRAKVVIGDVGMPLKIFVDLMKVRVSASNLYVRFWRLFCSNCVVKREVDQLLMEQTGIMRLS